MNTADRQPDLQSAPRSTRDLITRDERYDRYVRLMKHVLPAGAALVLIGVLAWPMFRESNAGFTLTFSEIDEFDDKVRMEAPQFTGTDVKDRSFSIAAASAYHEADNDERVVLDSINADVQLADGSWLALDAPAGVFHPKDENLDLSGQVNLFSGAGYEVHTRQLSLNIADGTATSTEAVRGQGPFGVFEAGGAEVDVRGDYVNLTDGVAMTVYPRAAHANGPQTGQEIP